MKSSAVLLSLAFCFFIYSETAAQQNRFRPQQTRQTARHSFAAGLAPFSLLLPSGKVNLRGEWSYADNKSLALTVGIPRPTSAPGFLANRLDLDGTGDATTNRYQSFGATLENRFYLGQNAPRGFYVAPYARYNRFSVTRTMENTENQYETTVKGAIGGFGLGASAGVQFRIGDFLSLDATLAGIDFKWLRGTLSYSNTDPETDLAAFRDKVQEAVEGIPIIGSRLVPEIEGNAVKVRTPGLLMPGYRFNLTINYLF